MRGKVESYSVETGAGVIRTDDGALLKFQRSPEQMSRPLEVGASVFFDKIVDSAVGVMVIDDPDTEKDFTGEDLSILGYIGKALAHYFDVEGRARRKEYWSFALFRFTFVIIAFIAIANVPKDSALATSIGLLLILGYLFLIIPTITLIIRRLHDADLSAWLVPALFIPLIGIVVGILVGFAGSVRARNKYGPCPKPG